MRIFHQSQKTAGGVKLTPPPPFVGLSRDIINTFLPIKFSKKILSMQLAIHDLI